MTVYTITDKATGRKAAGTFTLAQVCESLDGLDPQSVRLAVEHKGSFETVDDTCSTVIICAVDDPAAELRGLIKRGHGRSLKARELRAEINAGKSPRR